MFSTDSSATVLIDVRQPEDFEASPMPDAVNIPVYKMDFVEQVASRAALGDGIQLVGYAGDESARFAGEKLARHGFTRVEVLGRGGAAGEGDPIPDGTYAIDPGKSRLGWTGRNIASAHSGHIPILEGSLRVSGGRLEAISLVADMRRITCEDIEDRDTAAILEAHLKNEDFFEAERFPEARFTSGRIEAVGPADSPDYSVTGDLEIRGVSREVTVPAVFGRTFDGGLAASAAFELDRTEWGAIYGSPRFFRRLLGHFVRETISLDLTVQASR